MYSTVLYYEVTRVAKPYVIGKGIRAYVANAQWNDVTIPSCKKPSTPTVLTLQMDGPVSPPLMYSMYVLYVLYSYSKMHHCLFIESSLGENPSRASARESSKVKLVKRRSWCENNKGSIHLSHQFAYCAVPNRI